MKYLLIALAVGHGWIAHGYYSRGDVLEAVVGIILGVFIGVLAIRKARYE